MSYSMTMKDYDILKTLFSSNCFKSHFEINHNKQLVKILFKFSFYVSSYLFIRRWFQ